MVSMAQIHWEGRKRTIVTYKLIKRVNQFYDLHATIFLRSENLIFARSGPSSHIVDWGIFMCKNCVENNSYKWSVFIRLG